MQAWKPRKKKWLYKLCFPSYSLEHTSTLRSLLSGVNEVIFANVACLIPHLREFLTVISANSPHAFS